MASAIKVPFGDEPEKTEDKELARFRVTKREDQNKIVRFFARCKRGFRFGSAEEVSQFLKDGIVPHGALADQHGHATRAL